MSASKTPKNSDTSKRKADVAISPIDNLHRNKINIVLNNNMNGEEQPLSQEIDPKVSAYINLAISRAVAAVKAEYEDKLLKLSNVNTNLQIQVESLEHKVTQLENASDALEQYSRRNSIRISGIEHEEGENVYTKVIELAEKGDVTINNHDIDRAHRIGTKQDILVKFISHKKRNELLKAKKAIHAQEEAIWLAEDMTKKRSNILFEARKLRDLEKFKHVWTSDGTIIVRANNNKKKKIYVMSDLDQYR